VRILLDECVHAAVKAAFAGHSAKTIAEMGWRGTEDGPLLAYPQDSFDAFVTIDQKLEHQRDLKKAKLGVIIAHVRSNELASHQSIFPALLEAASALKAGDVIHVRVNPVSRER
jgi:hypothetical protein